MKRQRRSPLTKVNQYVALLLVGSIFLLPVFVTGQWIYGISKTTDHREVYVDIVSFIKRPADLSTPLKPFAEPILTITFDDGWESAYSVGLPIMQQNGIRSTQYILAGEFNNMAYLSPKQVKSFQQYNHEIAAHSFSHMNLTAASPKDLQREVVESKQVLEKRFGMIKEFASPLGAQNEETLKLIAQNYRSQRNTAADPATLGDEDVNTAQNFNQYNIIAYTVRRSTTPEDIQRLVNYAVQRKAWVVLTYHQLVDDGGEFSVAKDRFESQMKMLFQAPIRTATMGEVLDAIEAQKQRSNE